jgi:hypothetical protein
MDEEEDEIGEIQSDSGSGIGPNIETRSIQGDIEMEIPSYFCFTC